MAAITAAEPARTRQLSLRKIPLKPGELVAQIQIDLAGATFSKVSIPYDWGLEVSAPVAEACTLKAYGQHSSAFLSPEKLKHIATVTLLTGLDVREFTIEAQVDAISYDRVTGKESQRVIKLPKECILVE